MFLIGKTILLAQTQTPPGPGSDQTSSGNPNTTPAPPLPGQQQPAPKAAADEKTNWHFEIGGSFAHVTDNYGNWYGGDAKIGYTGFKRFSPSFSIGSQTRPEGTQQAYGFGSNININKYAYAIVGAGVAPNHGTILFPSFRFDTMGVVKVPKVKGLLATGSYTGYRMGGGSAKIASVGAIYYHKWAILNGGVSFNRSYPGSLPSKSAFLAFMRGRQGKYWYGGGISGGNLHYQLISIIPYDVRFNSYSFSAFFQKWLGQHWGIIQRYYFTNVMVAYRSNSVSASLFYDF